jgi:hypothetical protein
MSPRPATISVVNGFTVATAWIQPFSNPSGT